MTLKTKATFVDNEKVKKLFEKYDFNKNGVMEKEEFIKLINQNRLKLYKTAMAILKNDENAKICYDLCKEICRMSV